MDLSLGFRLNGRAGRKLTPVELMLKGEPNGMAFDVATMQLMIKDTITPANNYLGDANGKLVYASPSPKLIVNKQGVLEAGTALRCEYDPLTGLPLGIRVESQRTNLLTNSDFPNGVSDAPTRLNVVAASFPGLPSNTGLAIAADGLQAYAYKTNTTLTEGTVYTFSLFVYIDDELGAPAFSGTIGAATTDFGLIAQGVQVSMPSFVVERLGGRLYRVSAQYTAVASSGGFGVVRYATNRQRAFRISGYQFEAGAFPTSYIPTATMQVTRAADKVTLPVSAFPYSAAVSVVTQDIRPFPGAIAGDTVAIWSGTNANALSGYQQGGSAFVSTARASGSNVFVQNLGNPPANTFFRVATRYQVGTAASVRTNGTVMAPVMATMPAGLTEMILGSQGLAAAPNYWIRSLRYIPRAASDAELQAWAA